MNASPTDLRVILGKRPWRVWKGVGSFLMFEFGRPRRLFKESEKVGTFTIWIQMAEWRILKARRELAHSESSDKAIERAAEALQGKKVESATVLTYVTKYALRHGVQFSFEGGVRLIAWAYKRDGGNEAVFTLFSPDSNSSYCRDGTWRKIPSV